MRYILDGSNSIKRYGDTLFNVLDNGEATDAYAIHDVIFSNECEVTDGEFHGGEFHGGEFHGGVFRGGEFHGGEFRGGEFHGGVFRGGWLILQIQGSKHFVNIPDGKNIKIGCQCHDVDWWLSNYERVGRIEGYSYAQIKEYKMYIDLAAENIKNENQN